MPFVPFNNTLKIEPIYTFQGQQVENVFNYISNAAASPETAIDLIDAWLDWYEVKMLPYVTTDLVLTKVMWQFMASESSPGGEYTLPASLPGVVSSGSLPANVTLAVKWLTGKRGRSYRGRTYQLGLPAAQVTNSLVHDAYLNSLTASYNEMITIDGANNSYTLGVASKVSHGVIRDQGVITPVTNCTVENVCDSQRRRLPKRGK